MITSRSISSVMLLLFVISVMLTLSFAESQPSLCSTGWSVFSASDQDKLTKCFGSSTCMGPSQSKVCNCTNPRLTGALCEIEAAIESSDGNTTFTLQEFIQQHGNTSLLLPTSENQVHTNWLYYSTLPIANVTIQHHHILPGQTCEIVLFNPINQTTLHLEDCGSTLNITTPRSYILKSLGEVLGNNVIVGPNFTSGNFQVQIKTSYQFHGPLSSNEFFPPTSTLPQKEVNLTKDLLDIKAKNINSYIEEDAVEEPEECVGEPLAGWIGNDCGFKVTFTDSTQYSTGISFKISRRASFAETDEENALKNNVTISIFKEANVPIGISTLTWLGGHSISGRVPFPIPLATNTDFNLTYIIQFGGENGSAFESTIDNYRPSALWPAEKSCEYSHYLDPSFFEADSPYGGCYLPGCASASITTENKLQCICNSKDGYGSGHDASTYCHACSPGTIRNSDGVCVLLWFSWALDDQLVQLANAGKDHLLGNEWKIPDWAVTLNVESKIVPGGRFLLRKEKDVFLPWSKYGTDLPSFRISWQEPASAEPLCTNQFDLDQSFLVPEELSPAATYDVIFYLHDVQWLSTTMDTHTCRGLSILGFCDGDSLGKYESCNYKSAVTAATLSKATSGPIIVQEPICKCRDAATYGDECTLQNVPELSHLETQITEPLTWGDTLFTRYLYDRYPNVTLIDKVGNIIADNNNLHCGESHEWCLPTYENFKSSLTTVNEIQLRTPFYISQVSYNTTLPYSYHTWMQNKVIHIAPTNITNFQFNKPHLTNVQHDTTKDQLKINFVMPTQLPYPFNDTTTYKITWQVYLVEIKDDTDIFFLQNSHNTISNNDNNNNPKVEFTMLQNENTFTTNVPNPSDDICSDILSEFEHNNNYHQPNATYIPLQIVAPQLNIGQATSITETGVFEIPHQILVDYAINTGNDINFIAQLLPHDKIDHGVVIIRPVINTNQYIDGFNITSTSGCAPWNNLLPVQSPTIRNTTATCPFTCPLPFAQDIKCQCICTTTTCSQTTRIGQLYLQFGNDVTTQQDNELKDNIFTYIQYHLTRLLRLNKYQNLTIASQTLIGTDDITIRNTPLNPTDIMNPPILIGQEHLYVQPITSTTTDYRVLQYFIIIKPYDVNNIIPITAINARFQQIFQYLAKPLLYPTNVSIATLPERFISLNQDNIPIIATSQIAQYYYDDADEIIQSLDQQQKQIKIPIWKSSRTNNNLNDFITLPITTTTQGTQRYNVKCQSQPLNHINNYNLTTFGICPRASERSSLFWSICRNDGMLYSAPICIDMFNTTYQFVGTTLTQPSSSELSNTDITPYQAALHYNNTICTSSYPNYPQVVTTTCPTTGGGGGGGGGDGSTPIPTPPVIEPPRADSLIVPNNPIVGLGRDYQLSLNGNYRVEWNFTAKDTNTLATSTISIYLLNTVYNTQPNAFPIYPILLTTVPAQNNFAIIQIPTTLHVTTNTINNNVTIHLVVNQNTNAKFTSTQKYKIVDDIDLCLTTTTSTTTCGRNMQCNKYTGECKCWPNYILDTTTDELQCTPTCPQNCNNRGSCSPGVDITETPRCSCQEGYSGDACEIAENCDEEKINICFGRGSVQLLESRTCGTRCTVCDNKWDTKTDCKMCLLFNADVLSNITKTTISEDEKTRHINQQLARDIIPCYTQGTNLTATSLTCNRCVCLTGYSDETCSTRTMYGVIEFSGNNNVNDDLNPGPSSNIISFESQSIQKQQEQTITASISKLIQQINNSKTKQQLLSTTTTTKASANYNYHHHHHNNVINNDNIDIISIHNAILTTNLDILENQQQQSQLNLSLQGKDALEVALALSLDIPREMVRLAMLRSGQNYTSFETQQEQQPTSSSSSIQAIFAISATANKPTTPDQTPPTPGGGGGSSGNQQQQQLNDLYTQWKQLQNALQNPPKSEDGSTVSLPIANNPATQELGGFVGVKQPYDPNCKTTTGQQQQCPQGEDPFKGLYDDNTKEPPATKKRNNTIIIIIAVVVVFGIVIAFIVLTCSIRICRKKQICCFDPHLEEKENQRIRQDVEMAAAGDDWVSGPRSAGGNTITTTSDTRGREGSSTVSMAAHQSSKHDNMTSKTIQSDTINSTGMITILEDDSQDPLPDGWKKVKNTQDGQIYYINDTTLQSQKHRPGTELPEDEYHGGW